MRVFDRLVPTMGKFFTIMRNDKKIARVKGLYQNKKQIDLPFDTDIKVGDVVHIESIDETRTVSSIEKVPTIMGEGVDHLKVYFEVNHCTQQASMRITIHGNAIGSSFGQNAVSNYTVNNSIEQTIIEQGYKPEEFKELLNALKEALQNDNCKKGFLSKFSDTLSKHSWLSSAIAQEILRYFTGTIIG